MVNKALVKYIQDQLKKGFDAKTVRNYMLKYGYPDFEVDEAIKHIQSPEIRHVIHFSPATLIGIAVIFVSLIAVTFIFFNLFSSESKQLLDLNLEAIETTAEAGAEINFLTEISNLGSSSRYDINLKYEVISRETNKVLTFKEETRAIETIGSKQTKIDIPSDAGAGDYILRAIATYNGNRAVATLPIRISGKVEDTEEDVDIVIDEDEEEPEEQEETPEEEPEEGAGNTALTTFEALEEVEKIARKDKEGAENLCRKLQLQTSRDLCFNKIGEVLGDRAYCQRIIDERTKDVCLSNVAKNTDDSSICEAVGKDSRKDSCYMNFVIDKKDYTVCEKVTNQYLRQSCDSLRQLSKLNVTDVSFYEALINQSLFELV